MSVAIYPAEFGMFTTAGNRAAARIVEKVLLLPLSTSDKELYAFLSKEMNAISSKHGEVWDTDVREAIIGRIERAIGRSLTIYF